MEIQLTDHALAQLQERNLSEADVRQVIKEPYKITRQSAVRYRAIRKTRRRNKQYLLVVIYDAVGSRKEVVTVFLTSKIGKYL